MRVSNRKVQMVSFEAPVTQGDIDEGECRLANKCMIRVAIERRLRQLEPSQPNHHTRVDGGDIRFNYKGHRHRAHIDRVSKANLIKFDSEDKAKRRAKRRGETFTSAVKPFVCRVRDAIKGPKLIPNTRRRREQINAARRRRIAAGEKPRKYTLHKRVMGLA